MVSSAKNPKVSFIIPTLNEEKRLEKCLRSIQNLYYPKEKIEMVIADGGSKDKTLGIAAKFGAQVYKNKLETAESGKALGVKRATGEYIVLLDADNIIPSKTWLNEMLAPLVSDKKLLGSEPLYFTHRFDLGFIDRYCALMGMNDPLCFWFGSYDKMNVLSGKWTGLQIDQKDKSGYLEVILKPGNIPTLGANGCIFRRKLFFGKVKLMDDYLFDMDILENITRTLGAQKFAKVKTGIIHLYCGSNIARFHKKQLRRARDYLYRASLKGLFISGDTGKRVYRYGQKNSLSLALKIAVFVLSCVTIVPLIYQMLVGYIRKKDTAWLAHPLLCWVTLIAYTRGVIGSLFNKGELSRYNW